MNNRQWAIYLSRDNTNFKLRKPCAVSRFVQFRDGIKKFRKTSTTSLFPERTAAAYIGTHYDIRSETEIVKVARLHYSRITPAYALIPLKSRRESLPTVRVITPVAVTLIYRILLGYCSSRLYTAKLNSNAKAQTRNLEPPKASGLAARLFPPPPPLPPPPPSSLY